MGSHRRKSEPPGRRTTFTIGMTVAVLATALAWSGLSLKDLIATLFR
jgi:hypothetical protein